MDGDVKITPMFQGYAWTFSVKFLIWIGDMRRFVRSRQYDRVVQSTSPDEAGSTNYNFNI